jgi:hypothetical protein
VSTALICDGRQALSLMIIAIGEVYQRIRHSERLVAEIVVYDLTT